MELGTVNRTVSLMARMFNLRKSTVSILPVDPQKSAGTPTMIRQPFQRVSPESQGVSSAHIARFIEALQRDRTLNMHNLLMLRNGKVIAEATFGAQEPHIPKMTFSACKSITALAIGMLIDEGKLTLDTRVAELFPHKTTPVTRLRYKDLTVEHLLTMTSGATFNEAECMTQTDWVRGFFNSLSVSKPGKVFAYNSLNTYLLSAIVVQVSGVSLTEYLRPRLWEPLGIAVPCWETCPEGIEKGGWGLYLAPEDMAKIGQLVLQKGLWNGVSLISETWLAVATSFKQEPPAEYGDYHYGYHIWVGRDTPSFLFNGMLGQNVLGFPQNGILLVTNAGNDEMFQQSNYFSLATAYFGGTFPTDMEENIADTEQLAATISAVRTAIPTYPKLSWWRRLFTSSERVLPAACYDWDGRSVTADSPNAPSVGLLPMILQTVQNNYTGGLLSLHFHIVKERFFVTYRETDEDHRFEVGFDRPQITELYFHGEPYRVAVRGRFAKNEDDETVLILTMDFVETPCTRTLKVVWGEEIRLLQSERPGKPFLQLLLKDVRQKLDDRPLIGAAAEKLDEDYVSYKMDGLFSPTVVLKVEKA